MAWWDGGHWVTLEDGQHVLIDDENGTIMAGMGTQNNGKTFSELYEKSLGTDLESQESKTKKDVNVVDGRIKGINLPDKESFPEIKGKSERQVSFATERRNQAYDTLDRLYNKKGKESSGPIANKIYPNESITLEKIAFGGSVVGSKSARDSANELAELNGFKSYSNNIGELHVPVLEKAIREFSNNTDPNFWINTKR